MSEDQDPSQSDELQPGDVVTDVDSDQIAHFVTTIQTAEEQVGTHIIEALQHDNTVAVLTTVVRGPNGKDQIVSAALSPERMGEVQMVLQSAEEEREREDPCLGFHCLVKPKQIAEGDAKAATDE